MQASILVVSRHLPEDISKKDDGSNEPVLDTADQRNDSLDEFNRPRYRRALILHELQSRQTGDSNNIQFVKPAGPASDFDAYRNVQSSGLIEFFTTAWDRWDALGPEGQDPMTSMHVTGGGGGGGEDDSYSSSTPPLVPGNVPLPREAYQRPSKNVMGQVGYYCTDTCTAIFQSLKEELLWDAAVMTQAVDAIGGGGGGGDDDDKQNYKTVYALATHPGHHAAEDSFGGYCYLNHAAFCARQLQSQFAYSKVAVLDVDYVRRKKK
jgi:acetoin utilization deacetylase AcuC-like enzyme